MSLMRLCVNSNIFVHSMPLVMFPLYAIQHEVYYRVVLVDNITFVSTTTTVDHDYNRFITI